MAGLAPINALSEASAGFLWRLQDEGGDATAIPYDPDPLLIVNLSVWTSMQALRDFAFGSAHREYLGRRREWFSRLGTVCTAMWWIADGQWPTPAQARERLALLERLGPTARAFTFAQAFGPDE